MTQAKLASIGGFNERVIRKAEAGEPIRLHTLNVLAEALSTQEQPLSAADLRGDPLTVAQAYYDLRDEHCDEFALHCGHLLADDYAITVHADKEVLPYAGTWQGQDGLYALCKRIRHFFKPMGETVRFTTSNDLVLAMRQSAVQPLRDTNGRPHEHPPPLLKSWIFQEWTIANGRIMRDELYFDSFVYQRAMNWGVDLGREEAG